MFFNGTLYVITDQQLSSPRSNREVITQALAGGATAVQLREKALPERQLWQQAVELREITARAGAAFIINDRVDLALAVDADGVHLGQDDLPAEVARKLLGPGKILGISVTSVAEALAAQAAGADYLGVGPIYPTTTKSDARDIVGLAGLKEIRQVVSLPLIAIGGINLTNIREVISAGADGIAVVSAIVTAPDIAKTTQEMLTEILHRSRMYETARNW
ncbi:MAG: thiamine phosphate synthase [Firmicutes bacterium]|nr:thiamine phosphate synthase [Bacillota bacterium]